MVIINGIKLKRVNGWLDLDSYFKSILKRDYIDEEDLLANGLIEAEAYGRSDKFWILSRDEEKIALFKVQKYNSYEAYAELLSEEVANVLGFKTAHYDLATFNHNKGVISYNFRKEYDNYYSGFEIIWDFCKDEDGLTFAEFFNKKRTIDEVTDRLNNLENIWDILEKRFKDDPRKRQYISRIVNDLVNKLIFDILMVNIDDHCDNWGILDDIEEGKILAPFFDNARVLNLHNDILNDGIFKNENDKLQDRELLLNVDGSDIRKPLEVLEQFLKVSSSEYKDLVIDKVSKLEDNLEFIPGRIEEKICYPLPENIKDYFLNTTYDHLSQVKDVINNVRKK